MGKVIDLTGKRFGRLVVKQQSSKRDKYGATYWICDCDCGKQNIELMGKNLKNGKTKSCGCYRSENSKKIHYKNNKYDMSNDYGVGYTTNTNKQFYFDLEDYDLIKEYSWYEDYYGYIMSHREDKIRRLHRIVMMINDNDNMVVDHINHNTLDNRKCNLRIVEQAKNCLNRKISKRNNSETTGVYWNNYHHKWTATIRLNHKVIFIGHYNKLDDAIVARKQAEEKYFGEYSYDNSMKGADIIGSKDTRF